jgi:Uma2 family endonuclease
MQATEIKPHYSPAEYFALEDQAEFKSEYYDGEIVPMTGGSFNHNRIINRICAYLLNALQGKNYEPFSSDIKLWIPKYRKGTYPDVMVIEGEPEQYNNRTDTLLNPRLIIEVLSKSTEEYDRVDKFKFYRSIPDLQEYLLISQYEIDIQHYTKAEGGFWIYRTYETLEETIALTAINTDINVANIYEGIVFEDQSSAQLS